MPLDPQFSSLIERAQAAGSPGIHTLPLAEARAGYRDRYRARGPAHVEVSRITDLRIDLDGFGCAARLYDPAPDRPDDPVLVYFHGGGFVLGDIEAYDGQSRQIAARTGIKVLVPDYRLAPEHPYPAAVRDAIGVVRWVGRGGLGVVPSVLLVGGDSAGGNLAVTSTAAAIVDGIKVAGQLLLYPALDISLHLDRSRYPSVQLFAEGYFLDRAVQEWFFRQYLPAPERALEPRASPMLAQLVEVPKTVIVTAGFDPLRDVGDAYHRRLRVAGHVSRLLCFDQLLHNFLGFSGVIDAASDAFDQILLELVGLAGAEGCRPNS